jgi:hypothetical protein
MRGTIRPSGPKTSGGKRTSARNAITHGLLAREIVNTDLESHEDFQALLKELCDEFQPVGPTEQLLVDRIAIGWWRLARVHRAENGEVSKEINPASALLSAKALNSG